MDSEHPSKRRRTSPPHLRDIDPAVRRLIEAQTPPPVAFAPEPRSFQSREARPNLLH